jgi:hypothetical protein
MKAQATADRVHVTDSDSAPLALTDDQLDQIVRCAAPLHPELRRVFVEHVAYALRGKTIGDGTVYLACRQVLRESGMFDPPELDSGRMPRINKWDR